MTHEATCIVLLLFLVTGCGLPGDSFTRLEDYEQYHLLARTLEENPCLVPFIRGLVLYLWKEDQQDPTPRLLDMTRLRSLFLHPGDAKEAEQYLHKIAQTEIIVALKISPLFRHTQIAWDGVLSRTIHALEELTFSSMTVRIDDTHYDRKCRFDAASGVCTLKAFSLVRCDLVPGFDSLCALLPSALA